MANTKAELTDRQRSAMEKRDAAVPETSADTTKCDNHPDRDSVVTSDGDLHSVQSFCEECALANEITLPAKE